MPLVIVAIGVVLLLLLMIRFKMNGFIALVLVALAVGLMQGMPLDKVIVSIKNGVGGTLGSLALIMGFGAMLGKMLADCGGAQRIATTLIAKFGKKNIQWAVVLTGFTVGFALFYEVGFVLMLPLVFTIAAAANIPLLYVGVPMAAALSVTHGFLPPHPGPTAIATIFHADMGKTLLFGTILAIPTVILAGPVYARFLKGIDKPIPEGLHNPKTFTEEEMPGFGVSVWTSLVPVILMAMRAVAEMILPKGHAFLPIAEFFIWSDDWEYTRRISRAKPCYVIPASRVVHAMQNPGVVNIARDVPARWARYRYFYRNDVVLYRREGLSGWLWLLAKDSWHTVQVLRDRQGCRAERIKIIWKGFAAGVRFRPQIPYLP
mgnify:CR=1 FL=1